MPTRAFGRLIQFDERSRAFPVRALVATKTPRSYTWSCGVVLDQGPSSACVGFAWAHEASARPMVVPQQESAAHVFYREAQKLDEWAGEAYDGTSVIAGAKVLQQAGFIRGYRWAFGLEDLILAVGYTGPAVLGINWYEGMYDTDADGFIYAAGAYYGGHAIMCNGVSIKGRYFKLQNSWGASWGLSGNCKISYSDMERLLYEQGEACIPIGRTRPLV